MKFLSIILKVALVATTQQLVLTAQSAADLERKANLGDGLAMYKLAETYEQGRGVLKSFEKALDWYRRSAESGYTVAQLKLATIYEQGKLVSKDMALAYAWYSVAAYCGRIDAKVKRDRIGKAMTAYNATQAQTLAEKIIKEFGCGKTSEPKDNQHQGANIAPKLTLPSGIFDIPNVAKTPVPQKENASSGLVKGKNFTIPDLELEMIWVPPGKFMMGSPTNEVGRKENERQFEVTLTNGFWLGKYEVTQKQYAKIMGKNPSRFKGDKLPVEWLTWYDAFNFCKKLDESKKQFLIPSNYKYSMPMEAQWEYACRAGTISATAFGNSITSRQANFKTSNSPNLGKTSLIGSYQPNRWGFHDMHGNVWEMCINRYQSSKSLRVIRGGCFMHTFESSRSASRGSRKMNQGGANVGFRLCLSKTAL